MRSFSNNKRQQGVKIGFVPTMGYFHEGHLALMREAKKRANCVVTSIYVNPTQFGPQEDFSKYPRDLERDLKMAENEGVDVVFSPSDQQMYPKGFQTYIEVEEVTRNLCGSSRPGHFRGVTTVCAKLFNIIKPHLVVFGKKDFQQYVTIKQMITDLNMDAQIIAHPTVREYDGLAMSSRNQYLNLEERKSAVILYKSLRMAQKCYQQGERNASTIIGKIQKKIRKVPFTDIDYIKICDAKSLKDIKYINRESVVALAVRFGSTRLIDNYVFGEELKNINPPRRS